MSDIPTYPKVYVPRTKELGELERWVDVEPDTSEGRAAILRGRSGMGKTFLIEQFAALCRVHTGSRWYSQVIPFSPDSETTPPWERLLADAQALTLSTPMLYNSEDRKLFSELVRAVPVLGNVLAQLVIPTKVPAWQRFVEYLGHLSAYLVKRNERLVLVIDPRASMQDAQASDWVTVAQSLPPAIRLLIAQRPDDILAADLDAARRFRLIPEGGTLVEFSADQVEQFYQNELKWGRLQKLSEQWPEDTRRQLAGRAFEYYRGYPLAHGALTRLLVDQEPREPLKAIQSWPPEVEGLFDMLVSSLKARKDGAYHAMLTLHLFACPAPLEPWANAADIPSTFLKSMLADARFAQLLEFTEIDSVFYYVPFHPLFAKRLDLDLAQLPEFAERTVIAIWDTVKPTLDPQVLKQSRPPDFELRVTGGVIARLRDFVQLVEIVDQVLAVKIRLGWLDEAVADLHHVLNRPSAPESAVAACYGNLGVVYQTRGDLDEAESMHRKSLKINEELGRLEGMASDYGNLGLVYKTRGDLDEAESMFRKSLKINEQLGRLEGMANQYGNLGSVSAQRGDLDQAEAMYREALRINEQLDRREGIALQYWGLGVVCKFRGDLVLARAHLTNARDLFAKMDAVHKVELVQSLIDGLDGGDEPDADEEASS